MHHFELASHPMKGSTSSPRMYSTLHPGEEALRKMVHGLPAASPVIRQHTRMRPRGAPVRGTWCSSGSPRRSLPYSSHLSGASVRTVRAGVRFTIAAGGPACPDASSRAETVHMEKDSSGGVQRRLNRAGKA
jgi:hypothetical protein